MKEDVIWGMGVLAHPMFFYKIQRKGFKIALEFWKKKTNKLGIQVKNSHAYGS